MKREHALLLKMADIAGKYSGLCTGLQNSKDIEFIKRQLKQTREECELLWKDLINTSKFPKVEDTFVNKVSNKRERDPEKKYFDGYTTYLERDSDHGQDY